MPPFVIVALLGTWLLGSYQLYQAGNVTAAILLALVGLALGVWRFSRGEP
jgi:hypothetical protein